MQKSKALSSLRAIFPPIHQPLPLDKRESQRLLNDIKTSFRARLDAKYNFPDALKLPPTTIAHRPANAARAADGHLRTILTSPLFSTVDTAEATGGVANTWDAHTAVFERAVSRGLMTPARAQGFLMMVKSEAKQPAIPLLDLLKSTGAGLLVLRWVQSSGQERDLAFLANKSFRRLLMQFMVADGLDDALWVWVERLMKREDSSGDAISSRPLVAELICDFVTVKCLARELESAYTAMLKAEAIAKENQISPVMLQLAWRSLAWHTTVNACRHVKAPVHLFDPFVTLGQTIPSRRLDLAHVNLHHPVDPTPGLAVEYLSNKTNWKGITGPPTVNSPVERYINRLTLLGLDTVQHLQQANETREASRVWALLERNLGWLALPKTVV
ncbi:hypothetical protein C8A00DRAFT_33778 [Chaetomidium leptoderma]|uniref:Uncharacterized protein n=1 Tax=Chaetomidium leptoderma TaxID=669021 RepID=A0AAN6ZWI4_9PEZI|nr:hypothetical protein C8A00DRAFT_33778 [Chaetomidium leptoderma]